MKNVLLVSNAMRKALMCKCQPNSLKYPSGQLARPPLLFLHLPMIPTTLSDMDSDITNDYMYCAFVAFLNFFTVESFYSSPYTVRSSAKPIKTSLNTNWKLFYPCSCSCLSIVQAKHFAFQDGWLNATDNNLCECSKLELVSSLLHCLMHVLYFQK